MELRPSVQSLHPAFPTISEPSKGRTMSTKSRIIFNLVTGQDSAHCRNGGSPVVGRPGWWRAC